MHNLNVQYFGFLLKEASTISTYSWFKIGKFPIAFKEIDKE